MFQLIIRKELADGNFRTPNEIMGLSSKHQFQSDEILK